MTAETAGETLRGVSLNVTQEAVAVPPSLGHSVADPGWSITDKEGHQHWVVGGGKTPTLTTLESAYWCKDCRDHHTAYTTVCRACGEEVEVGTVFVPGDTFQRYMPGLVDYQAEISTAEMTATWQLDKEAAAFVAAVAAEATSTSGWTAEAVHNALDTFEGAWIMRHTAGGS